MRFDKTDAATDKPRQRKQEAEKEEVAVYLEQTHSAKHKIPLAARKDEQYIGV